MTSYRSLQTEIDYGEGIEKPPELKLLSHLLLRSILDLMSGKHLRRREAYRWIYSNDSDSFTFIDICDHLGLKPNVLRRLIEKMPAYKIKEVRGMRLKESAYTTTGTLANLVGFQSKHYKYNQNKKAKKALRQV